MASKHKLSSRGWLALFALSVVLLGAGLGLFNFLTDPFGVFGDRVLGWWSYNETNNPRTAKFSYLEQHHEAYDSYIIGCSSTSSFPKEQLDEYFDASFYNLIMYGADMRDVEQYARYLIDHYTVKNLVLNVYEGYAQSYGFQNDSLTDAMPWQADGGSPIPFYARYLFANPRYGWEKLKKLGTDSMIQDVHDVFDVESGAYDKSRRDVEHIGSLDSYLAAYPEFLNYPRFDSRLTQMDQCLESVAAIRDLCREAGVNFLVVTPPLYYDYLAQLPRQEVERFYTSLAEITPFWDFSSSSVSRDPRYFYDTTHFRNCVGKMALARVFGDESVYVPADFGVYVTADNVAEHMAGYWDVPDPDAAEYSTQVPILMYHDLEGDSLPAAQMEEQLAALAQAGYTSVTLADLRAYVEQGAELPEKPIVITFDDGYLSNMTYGLPILEKYGMNATIFVIGCSVGKDTYKDTGVAMRPHFSLEQAREMMDTGLITIGSHGYDFHEVEGRDPDPIRQGILRREDETEEAYAAFLREDCRRQNELLRPILGGDVDILAYPYGAHETLSEILLQEAGIYATVTISPGINTIVKGIPQSLLCMNRFNIDESMTGEGLLALLENSPP